MALYRFDSDLDADSLDTLENLGDLLNEDPPDLEDIDTAIDDLLTTHTALTALYQEALTQLDRLDLPDDYLPDEATLEQQLSIEVKAKGYFGGKPRNNLNEIGNLMVLILTSDKPQKTAKKIEGLDKYWELPPTPLL
ncbi:hypothetical protein [Oxynema aestuarii]|uniref:Uncharacterized protein n=1 Tax=Oxynema aestuarii AP17 TaxID=2064643 RepID=A0A6H1U3H3_9CYAN|nr:hypothetical protein [Oxynema aestuarii]QIZ72927.1 hypothetical protein HCG48_21915 [Oxynema aestuarii AP17]